MPNLPLFNSSGERAGEVEVGPEMFGVEPNEAVVHQVVVAHLAKLRSGSAATKTRGEVRGGGKKPWRQKGTGRARAGSIRSPLWKGGGITFGPQPRDHSATVPKKMKKLALASALSAKAAVGEIMVVDQLKMSEISTRKLAETLQALDLSGTVLIVLPEVDPIVMKSGSNLPGVEFRIWNQLDTYQVIRSERLLFVKDALSRLEESKR